MDFSFKLEGLPATTNEASQTISSGYDPNSHTSARLFLFSPRNFVNIQKRPVTYNFNMEFFDDMKENINNIVDRVGTNYSAASFMNGYRSALDAVTLDGQGFMMDTQRLSDFWTFVLQIDNEQLNTGGMYNGPRLNNRYIYSGFCSHEPVSSLDGLRVTVNPNCVLQITHSTSMSLQKRFSPAGDFSQMRVNNDIDLITPSISQQLNTNATNLLTPDKVHKSHFDDEYTGTASGYVSNMESALRMDSGSLIVPSFFNSPKHHLKHIVGGVMQSIDEINMQNTGSGQMRTIAPELFGSTRLLDSTLSNFLATPAADNMISIDPVKPWTIGELQYKYPDMMVVPIGAEKLSLNDLADQSVTTRANVASAILVAAIPPIINDHGLCEFAFFYRSYDASGSPFINMGNQELPDQFHVSNAATWSVETSEMLKLRIKAIFSNLKNQLFPIIKNMGGDFDLSCSCNSVGECNVMIYFKDEPHATQGIYESPLLLGGINSPLVGSFNHLQHNSLQMSTMVSCLDTEIVPKLPNNPYRNIVPTNPLDTTFKASEQATGNIFNAFNNVF